jgi:hypothetical protein
MYASSLIVVYFRSFSVRLKADLCFYLLVHPKTNSTRQTNASDFLLRHAQEKILLEQEIPVLC